MFFVSSFKPTAGFTISIKYKVFQVKFLDKLIAKMDHAYVYNISNY